MPASKTQTISCLIACYNESANIALMHERLTSVLAQVPYQYEILYVENGSTDTSRALLEQIARGDPTVRVVVLSRNFGSQAAFSAGLAQAKGDCAILLDGDLQDPPELIPELLERWREGYDVVYGHRVKRKAALPLQIAYKAFYRIFAKLSYIPIPTDAGDFGLIDQRVIKVMNSMPERNRLLRGLRAWAGFRQCGVPYVRDKRHGGRTSNSILSLFGWAQNGIISYSFAPLELISLITALVIVLTAIAIVVYLVLYLLHPSAPQGFQTLLTAILFLGAVQLLSLSIIGMYVARIFEEVKARPSYIIESILQHKKAATSEARASRGDDE